MDLSKLTVVELKAQAYDMHVGLEIAEKNLHIIQLEIAKRMSEPKVTPAV